MDFSIEEYDESPIDRPDTPACRIAGCDNPVAPHSGRGRKPTMCVEHKGARGSGTASSKGNSIAAKRAARTIRTGVVDPATVGMLFAGFPATAGVMGENNDQFEADLASALELNPGLCKSINTVGKHAGIMMVFAAFASYGMKIVPVAIEEYAMRED